MVGTLLVGAIISLLVALAVSFLSLRTLQQTSTRIQAQQQAWERTQEVRQQQWKAQQERQALEAERQLREAEKQLRDQAQLLRSERQALERENSEIAESLQQQFEAAKRQVRQEYELGRLSRIEDTPLPPDNRNEQSSLTSHQQAPDLMGADLAKRDLSSRYLSHANLRDARLTQANLFMADLSWAHLTNANLAGANLSAANLSHTDLQGANLEGANFLVTDLYNAILIGADLRQSHNLTTEQISSAIYNETTRFDPEVAQTLQGQPDIQQLASSSQSSQSSQSASATSENTTLIKKEPKITNQPDELEEEENKLISEDISYFHKKASEDVVPAKSDISAENSSLSGEIINSPEEMAENA